MTTAWAHLPNAALVDEVRASIKARPAAWGAAWVASWGSAQPALLNAARDAARSVFTDAALRAVRDAIHAAVSNAVLDAAAAATRAVFEGASEEFARAAAKEMERSARWGAIHAATRDTSLALAAYDDAGLFMKMPVEHLQRLYRIDPHPMYLLLQPAAIVFAED